MLIHFVANFPHELFDLELKLNMNKLLETKLKKKKILFEKHGTEDRKTIMTVTGHSALAVCMLDEKIYYPTR